MVLKLWFLVLILCKIAQKFQSEIDKMAVELEENKVSYSGLITSIENGLRTFELRLNSFSQDSEASFKTYRKETRTVADNLEQIKMNILGLTKSSKSNFGMRE